MGPDRKDKLKAPDATDRLSQEADELVLASKRLVEEMQALAERAKKLAEERGQIVKATKARRRKL